MTTIIDVQQKPTLKEKVLGQSHHIAGGAASTFCDVLVGAAVVGLGTAVATGGSGAAIGVAIGGIATAVVGGLTSDGIAAETRNYADKVSPAAIPALKRTGTGLLAAFSFAAAFGMGNIICKDIESKENTQHTTPVDKPIRQDFSVVVMPNSKEDCIVVIGPNKEARVVSAECSLAPR